MFNFNLPKSAAEILVKTKVKIIKKVEEEYYYEDEDNTIYYSINQLKRLIKMVQQPAIQSVAKQIHRYTMYHELGHAWAHLFISEDSGSDEVLAWYIAEHIMQQQREEITYLYTYLRDKCLATYNIPVSRETGEFVYLQEDETPYGNKLRLYPQQKAAESLFNF